MIWTDKKLNAHIANCLDAYRYIIKLLNAQNHLNITTNNEGTSVPMKRVIVHRKHNPIAEMMITIKIYIHLWHVYLVMKKVLVEILVIVHN